MSNLENEIERLESQVPELSATAISQAYAKALKSGSVHVSEDSENGWAVFEVFADGTRRFVKPIEAPSYRPAGTTIQIP